MVTLNFSNNKPYDTVDNRPYLDVLLTDPSGKIKSPTYPSLVDTGSDYIILPTAAAAMAGIPLSGKTKTIRSATGSASFNFETGLNVIVAGYSITADVLFDPSPSSAFVPILGRPAILAAFDVGFNLSDCLWT